MARKRKMYYIIIMGRLNGAKECFALVLAVFSLLLAGCEKPKYPLNEYGVSKFTDYREIPGVTEEEIRAIESLKASFPSFIYGANPSTEAFLKEDGSPGGYSAFCMNRFSELFGIPFSLKIYEWAALWDGLLDHSIDFSGELTATPERREIFYMSGVIAERSVKIMRILGSEPLERLARGRPLNCCFLDGTTTPDDVKPFISGAVNFFFVNDYDEAYELLKSGDVDAFYDESPAEAAFDIFGDVFAEDFYPLIYSQVSLTTGNPALAPFISVVDKYLAAGGLAELASYYSLGYREYLEHKLFAQFSDEEKSYIQNVLVRGGEIPVFAESDSYPSSFWNAQEKEWQGIAHDVLREIGNLTGLRFLPKNEINEDHFVLQERLEAGEGLMILDLVKSEDLMGSFLWADLPYTEDNFALISKNEFPNLSINEVLYNRVGLLSDSAHHNVFREWFPRHDDVFEYDNYLAAVEALQKGTIDLLMANQNFLLYITNYLEMPGYKTNIVFVRPYESYFAFNINEDILCSIISKAQKLVDTRIITSNWTRRIFDYRGKLARAQVPWLGGTLALCAAVLLLLIVLLVRNRNEGRRLESIIHQRTRDLEAQTIAAKVASHAKGEFLAHMSHELRTPLNAIIGMSHIAGKYTDSEKALESLGEITTASNHLLGILNDVLDMSKIESGMFALIHQPFELRVAFTEISEIIKMRCIDKQLQFIYSYDEIPDVTVLGDKLRLKQILINLLGNSVKFTPEGGQVELQCVRTRIVGKEIFLSFRIIDSGIGMSEEQMKKLFTPFEQTDPNIAVRFGGTGLGLVISQDLVNQMGGQITVQSKLGEGSVFSFTIGLDVTEPVKKKNLIPDDFIPELRGKRILLAEDIEINRIIIGEILSDTHVDLEEAVDGQDAVDKFSAAEPGYYDLIFMDVMMPNLNGYEAASRIRDIERDRRSRNVSFKTIPIFAMTANAYREDIDKAFYSGMNGHIAKPVDSNIIMRILGENFPDSIKE